MEHVFIVEHPQLKVPLLECYSSDADYDYYVWLKNIKDISRAAEIIENELTIWGGGFDELTDPERYDYYYYSGYGEVVENALKANTIPVVRFFYDDDANFITTLLEGK